jgi:tetratricopeptide (TPR) repeat protein
MLPTLSTWLREQRLAHGWNVAEMGRQIQHAARTSNDHTVPSAAILASYVRRWETAKIAPTERYRLHYCRALGIQPADFGPPGRAQETEDELVGMPVPAFVPALPADAGARLGTDLSYWTSEPSSYREAKTGHDALNCAEQQPYSDPPLSHLMTKLAEESLDFGEWADTSNIGDATLENYATQVRRLASDYQCAPPYPLLLETKQLRDGVFAKLQGHQRPGQSRDLYLVASQVCGLLAWMSGDMSFYRAADTHAWTAWVCAEQANHDGARTWIRATQSKLAYWDGRFIESARLAEDGFRYNSADSGKAMAALFHARALARLGRSQDAANTLSQARAELERVEPDDVGGLWSVIPARFHSLASDTQVWRHDPARVLAETDQALEQFEVASPRERNYGAVIHTRINQAQAHLLLRDLDGADAALRAVLVLAPENRYEPITQQLGQIRNALAGPEFRDSSRARDLQGEIETYCRESIVKALTN